jgi:L-alanine-DL-glutamate epimerase-like enolase superfamily enzyme
MMAMSAIDVALWDIKGKPRPALVEIARRRRDHIATHASGALRAASSSKRR